MSELATTFISNFSGIACWAWFLAAAVLMSFSGHAIRATLLVTVPVLGLLSVLATPYGDYLPLELFGLGLKRVPC